MLLGRFSQSNNLRKKIKGNLGTFNRWPDIVPKMSFQGHLGDILRAYWGGPVTFLGCQVRTSPGRHFKTSSGWSNSIFRIQDQRESWGRPRNLLGINICQLKTIQFFRKNTEKYLTFFSSNRKTSYGSWEKWRKYFRNYISQSTIYWQQKHHFELIIKSC